MLDSRCTHLHLLAYPGTGGDVLMTNLGQPLLGRRICLVFEYSLSHYTRLLTEIEALQDAGATVQLLTSHPNPSDTPGGLKRTWAPMGDNGAIRPSAHPWRPIRILSNLTRNALQTTFGRLYARPDKGERSRVLHKLSQEVDIFWVVNFPSLPSVIDAVQGKPVSVVYESVDLVPEYLYAGKTFRRQMLAAERRHIGRVDGFITACDSYADYYWERYGGQQLKHRPVVRNDMPGHVAESSRATTPPLRLLFFGSLMRDRPVFELIDAMSLIVSDATLTLQGQNLLGSSVTERIEALGLQDRVRVTDPCPSRNIVAEAARYDIGVVALRGANENERRASTTKLFTYMAAGLAVLGSDLPGIARVVRQHDNGALVQGNDPEAWARAIDCLADLPSTEIDAMKRRSLVGAHVYSWDHQEPAFLSEFIRALGAGEK